MNKAKATGVTLTPAILESACRLSMLSEQAVIAEVESPDWRASGTGDWRTQVGESIQGLWGSLEIEARLAVFILSLEAAQEIAESDRPD